MTLLILTFLLSMIAALPGEAKNALPDSLLTINKAYTYTLSDTDTSLAILQAMRQKKMEPDWRLNICEGDVYMNNRQVRRALPYYEAALDDHQLSDSLRMAVYKRLMDAYDLLQEHQRLMYYIYQLRNFAQQHHDNHFLALAEFMAGKHMHYHGERQQGYEKCRQALELMKASTNARRLNELRAFYAEYVKMYMRDGRYDDAMRASLLQEQAARERSLLPIQRLDDRAMRRVYALRATLLAVEAYHNGASRTATDPALRSASHEGLSIREAKMAEADAAYALWRQTTGGNPIDDREVLGYLILSGHNDEAATIINRYKDFLRDQGDSISFGMLSILYDDARVLLNQGLMEPASENLSTVRRIADSLHVRSARNQMSVTYQLLEEQKEDHRHQLVISWLVALLVLLVAIGIAVVYYNRIISHRNKAFQRLLNGLDAYRNANISSQPQTLEDEASAHMGTDPRVRQASQQGLPRELTPEPTPREPQDDDERLFVEMDRQVTRDKLFLKPDLSREDLMRLIGVDKNRFGRMISIFSEASNASVYINTKRVEYGALLIKQHPDYTIASIAEACGLQNTVTFNRAFRRVFGVTPSEYRANLEETV